MLLRWKISVNKVYIEAYWYGYGYIFVFVYILVYLVIRIYGLGIGKFLVKIYKEIL